MKLLGFACLALFAFGASRCFVRYEGRRIREVEGLLSLLLYMKTAMKRYALPLGTLYAEFECEALAASGFLAALRRDGLHAALCAHSPQGMSEQARGAVLLFAEHLGSRFLEDEMSALEEAARQLSGELSRMMGEAPRRRRMGRALITTVSMMIFLLFV